MRKLSVLFLCAVVAVSCGRNTVKTERVVPVSVIVVGDSEASYTKSYDGTVSSARFQIILAPHSGRITSLNAKVGSNLREEQTFAHIDAPDVNSLHDANQATLRQARDGYARAKKVYENGGLSELKWMDVQTKLAQAEASAEISDRSLAKCDIKAPFNGTVSAVDVSLGEQVTMGTKIATIIDENNLKVTIHIPENEYSLVKENSKAEISFPSLYDETVSGKIVSLGVNSNSMTHSYEADVILDKKPAGLKSGMICKVYLQHCSENRLIIPASVVKVDEGGSYVWLVNSRDKVVKRHVETGKFVKDGIAISGGLISGEKVIVAGTSKVSSGMKVNPKIVTSK